MLDFIDQIIVEIHPNNGIERDENGMISMINTLRTLHSLGFHIVDYSPNLTMGRYFEFLQYYPYFDITLVRQM